MFIIYLDHIQPESSLPLLQPDSPNLPLRALCFLKQLPHAHEHTWAQTDYRQLLSWHLPCCVFIPQMESCYVAHYGLNSWLSCLSLARQSVTPWLPHSVIYTIGGDNYSASKIRLYPPPAMVYVRGVCVRGVCACVHCLSWPRTYGLKIFPPQPPEWWDYKCVPVFLSWSSSHFAN